MSTPLSYSLASAAAATSLSRSQLDRAIRAGHLRAKRSSVAEDGEPTGKYVILASELERYLESLVDA